MSFGLNEMFQKIVNELFEQFLSFIFLMLFLGHIRIEKRWDEMKILTIFWKIKKMWKNKIFWKCGPKTYLTPSSL